MSEITFEQLQSVLNPEAFTVIAPLFTNLAQRLQTSEDQVAELQRERLTVDQLSTSLRESLSHLSAPSERPGTPSGAITRAPLKTELPIFRGRPEENVSAFISISKDLLKATHISQEDWGVIHESVRVLDALTLDGTTDEGYEQFVQTNVVDNC
ncbi:hypothetical protein F5880DRAFT_1511851 [Lentinula raphanica]|nr:hypothetical protein F5880DRAFT_1511851 [Lentinula raphanica]